MWAIAGLFSAVFLGIYDIFKKTSLNGNAVMPVLFFSTLTSTFIFLPIVLGSKFFPESLTQIGLYSPTLSLIEHLQILLKSAIVVSSWILAFFAFVAVEHKLEIADFDKPGRQRVQQEAPDELIGGQGHPAGSIVLAAILVGENHLPIIHR